jgi:hypothetical protein
LSARHVVYLVDTPSRLGGLAGDAVQAGPLVPAGVRVLAALLTARRARARGQTLITARRRGTRCRRPGVGAVKGLVRWNP